MQIKHLDLFSIIVHPTKSPQLAPLEQIIIGRIRKHKTILSQIGASKTASWDTVTVKIINAFAVLGYSLSKTVNKNTATRKAGISVVAIYSNGAIH